MGKDEEVDFVVTSLQACPTLSKSGDLVLRLRGINISPSLWNQVVFLPQISLRSRELSATCPSVARRNRRGSRSGNLR
jgi:hypothetical protein